MNEYVMDFVYYDISTCRIWITRHCEKEKEQQTKCRIVLAKIYIHDVYLGVDAPLRYSHRRTTTARCALFCFGGLGDLHCILFFVIICIFHIEKSLPSKRWEVLRLYWLYQIWTLTSIVSSCVCVLCSGGRLATYETDTTCRAQKFRK